MRLLYRSQRVCASVFLLMVLLLHCSAGAFASAPFPFLMDIGGLSGATLSPPVPRVAAGRIFECPHPCGLVPHFDGAGQPVNGGLPQAGNMSLHLEMLRATFDKYVPLNESRLMDFDFEDWNPVWARNSPSASPNVRNASVARVRAAHPDWDPDTVEAAAQAEFESAAQTWLAATMTYMRQIRPQLRVAMYGYPTRYYYHGYNDTTQGPLLRAQNDALFPLWCHMDAIMPSVYQFYDSCNRSSARAPNEEYVRSNVREAVRIAGEVARRCAAQTKPPPVLVYTWHRYHDGTRFVCDADETMTWSISAEEGANGVVLWGDERQTEDNFETYWAKDFAPLALAWSPPELPDSGT